VVPRIVIDTNVLVASAYHPHSASGRIVDACCRGERTMVVSPAIRSEYDRILPRAIPQPERRKAIDELLTLAIAVQPGHTPRLVPDDPDDDKFMAAAVAAGAVAVVTSDEHLLRLDAYEGIRILQPERFVRFVAEG
jgi:putative PIN family toxin of toxin-antitoxin system